MYYLYFMKWINGTYSELYIAGKFATKENAEAIREYLECTYPNCYTKIKFEA